MALSDRTSLVDLTHIKQLHLPPIVIPQQQQQQPVMTDGFMLFCADQTSPSLPVKATSVLYERWNALPNESKRPYYRQAIIVNAKLEEDDEPTPLPPPPMTTMMTPTRLVPPEAIRSAALEEKEEAALGQQHPFASYPSFLSMKHSHEQQQQQRQASPETSPSPCDRMTISHLLPPPVLPPQQQDTRYLSDEPQRRKGSITLERLKRPPNAYLLFNRDMRRKLLELDPKMTVSEISKDIGDRWKYLSSNERQPYIDAAQALKQDHLKNHPDFVYSRRSKAELAEAKRLSKAGRKRSSSSPKQPPQQPSPVLDKPIVTKKSRGQQQRRDPRGRKKKQAGPKHPMSGFLFFLGAIRPQVARQFPGSTVGPISKEISARWKKMTDKEREPWLLKAESDKARYAQEMQAYMATQRQQQELILSPRQDQDDDFDDDQVIATVVQMVNGPSPTSSASSSLPFI